MVGEERWKTIEDVRAEAIVCCRCDLCYSRTHVVFGEGPSDARLMMVGEGPGQEEDKLAYPFVGRAGQYLTRLVQEVGMRREDIWVTNIVRCRPCTRQDSVLRNRTPQADEIKACDMWMAAEYRFVDPELVLCLGGAPAQALISKSFRIREGRGRWHEGRNGKATAATYHPAYVFRLRGDDRRSVESQMLADLELVSRRLDQLVRAA